MFKYNRNSAIMVTIYFLEIQEKRSEKPTVIKWEATYYQLLGKAVFKMRFSQLYSPAIIKKDFTPAVACTHSANCLNNYASHAVQLQNMKASNTSSSWNQVSYYPIIRQ